jgi:hypothetical protein
MTSLFSSLNNVDPAAQIGSLSRSRRDGFRISSKIQAGKFNSGVRIADRSLIFWYYVEQSLDLCSEFVRISASNLPKIVRRCCELVESAALGQQRCRERSVEIWQ